LRQGSYNFPQFYIEGVFTLKKKKKKKLLLIIYSPPCHSFFSQNEIKVFDENIPGFSPYNGLQWEPNGSGPKDSFSAN